MTRALAFILFLSSGVGGCASLGTLATPANVQAVVTIATAILQAAKQ